MLKWWITIVDVPSERGASLVEYALLIALIALVVVVAVQIVGEEVSLEYRRVGRALHP